MITDRQIYWNRKRLWLPAHTWQNGSISGTILMSEITINSVGMSLQGIVWDGSGTTGYTASSVVQGKYPVPHDMNPEFPLGFRIHFTHENTTSPTNVFTPVALFGTKLGESDIFAQLATGALDTPFPAQSLSTATGRGRYRISNRGIKNANWASRANIFTGKWMEFSVGWLTLTGYTVGVSPNRLWIMGMMIDYVPMLTRYPHSEIDAPEDDAFA